MHEEGVQRRLDTARQLGSASAERIDALLEETPEAQLARRLPPRSATRTPFTKALLDVSARRLSQGLTSVLQPLSSSLSEALAIGRSASASFGASTATGSSGAKPAARSEAWSRCAGAACTPAAGRRATRSALWL